MKTRGLPGTFAPRYQECVACGSSVALAAGREDIYFRWFYSNYCARPDALPEADIAEYLRTYRQPGALRAGFSDYRAIPQDITDNATTAATFKLPMPVLALGGDGSWGRGIEVVDPMNKSQQMRWPRRGADLPLQVRCALLQWQVRFWLRTEIPAG